MFKLRTGYFVSGITTGLVLLFTFLTTLPDGKLHIYFCDVGQGDAALVRFPDGRDMVVDGGPNDKVVGCLGKHMPFWDRQLDMVLLTHPQKDHMQGLIEVMRRYDVDYFLRSDIENTTEGYKELLEIVKEKNIPVKFLTSGQVIDVGPTTLSILWPSKFQIAKGVLQEDLLQKPVLGAQSVGDLNDYSLVFWLRYGAFDALFTGDADTHVENEYIGSRLADNVVEVLKVPHHGSKTGMNEAFVDWLAPKLAVISVGKNSYGHPAPEAVTMLRDRNVEIRRTDEEGDIEVISDGVTWQTAD